MGWLVIRVPLSNGLFVVVEVDGDGEEMTNACIVLGSGGDDGSEVEVVVMMEVHFFILLLTVVVMVAAE